MSDAGEMWCVNHGSYNIPRYATEPIVEHYPNRNRRIWTAEEDTVILALAGSTPFWRIGRKLGRSRFQIVDRFKELTEHAIEDWFNEL